MLLGLVGSKQLCVCVCLCVLVRDRVPVRDRDRDRVCDRVAMLFVCVIPTCRMCRNTTVFFLFHFLLFCLGFCLCENLVLKG